MPATGLADLSGLPVVQYGHSLQVHIRNTDGLCPRCGGVPRAERRLELFEGYHVRFCDVYPFQGHHELSDGSAIEVELQADFLRLVSLATTGAPDSACSALFLAVASQGSRESKTTISNGSMRSSSSRIRSHRAKLIELEPAASASHSPHETRSSGPEYRAIQTEHRVVQTEYRVAVTTRSTPCPPTGPSEQAHACPNRC